MIPMMLNRREVLSHSSMAMAGATALGRRGFAQSDEPKYVEVKTAYPRVRGLQGNALVTFKGISYAKSVAGANRFRRRLH